MIRYSLRCDSGHEFEGWFRSSAAFDDQAAAGLLSCVQCGSAKVEKALMAPNVAKSGEEAPPKPSVPARVPHGAHMPPKVLELLREMRDHVHKNADYVGNRFADEARKIHYEETEARGIYGEATPAEARALHEEGIAVHPMPHLPEDAN